MCSLCTVILALKYDINLSTSIQYHYKHMHACISHFSCVQLFVTPWTVAHQAPLSMGILQARILEWVVMPFSRDLPNPGIASTSLMSPALAGGSLPRGTWETPTLAQIPSFLIHIIVPTPTLLPGLSPSHHSLKFKWVWSFQEINLGKSFHWLLPKYPSTASKFLFYLKQAYFTTFLSGQAFSPFQKFFILLSWCLSWMCHDGYRLLCLCLCHSLCASNALCISSFSWLATTHKCGWVLNLLFSFPLTSFPRPRFKLCAPILCSQSTWTSPIIMSGYCFFIACLFVCFHTLKNVQSVSTYLTIPSPWFCMILDQLGSIKLTKQSINWINEWMNGRMDGWMDG